MTLLGTFFVWIGFVAIVASIAMYVRALRITAGDDAAAERLRAAARGLFVVAAGCVIGTAVVLQVLIQTHRFDVDYVYKYSALGMQPRYLFATFWAGQQGSFLLWAFWTSILGVVLALSLKPVIERRVMPFYGGILAFLLLLLAVKSPFLPYGAIAPMDPNSGYVGSSFSAFLAEIAFIFQTPFAHHAFAMSMPTDGNGLNPLLENPWMVIHPPTLFLGFSATAIPFAFAISALVFGGDAQWYRRAWPWALFCFAVLGFGVMLGGYWAYDTLGWGGFWAWDPVENGPLVPWLLMVGLLHSMQVQRVRGALKPTTYLLGLLPFGAALYETFLTRTGVLDAFSNHSFSTLGGIANSIILWGMLLTVIFSLGILIWRSAKIKSENDAWANISSREFGFLMAILLLAACALFTGIGMSAPLITAAGVKLGIVKAASSVPADFYNKANFPIAVLLAIGMGVGPYLAWRGSTGRNIAPAQAPYALAVVFTLLYFLFAWLLLGIRVPVPLLLLFAAASFSLLANLRLLTKRRGEGEGTPARTLGGTLAHVGGAFFLLGIALMVAYTRKSEPVLYTGHAATLGSLPYTMTYVGMTKTMRDPDNLIRFKVESRPEMDLSATVGRLQGRDPISNAARANLMSQIKREIAHPAAVAEIGMPLAVRKQEGRAVLLARPVIQTHWWGDMYYALKSGPDTYYTIRPDTFSLLKGQTKILNGYVYTFNGFSVPAATAAQLKNNTMPDVVDISADMTVIDPSGRQSEVAVHNITNRQDPLANPSPDAMLPKLVGKPDWGVSFQGMNADKGLATFAVRDVSLPSVIGFTLEVSTRPFVGFVWLGTVLIALGGLISMRKRATENRLIPVDDPEAEPREDARAPERRPRRGRDRAGAGPIPAGGASQFTEKGSS